MTVKKIALELARTAEFPNGNADIGYEFFAPLDAEGHLDTQAWKAVKKDCTVRRFAKGEDDEHGVLVHHRGHAWAFSYEEGDLDEEEEPIFRFDTHQFVTGEYVSVREHDGEVLPFRIISVA